MNIIQHPSIILIIGRRRSGFDLRKGEAGEYHLSSKKFDIEASIEEFKENEISIVLDVESAYPLNKEDVALNVEETVKEEKEDRLAEFAKKMEL